MKKSIPKKKVKVAKIKIDFNFKKLLHQPIKPVTKRATKLEVKKIPDFAKRTKITKQQMEIVNGSSGKGVSAKFMEDGSAEVFSVSLILLRKLNKAKKNAEKFRLFTDQLGRRLYVGDRELMVDELHKDDQAFITFNRKQALIFLKGFDEPEVKSKFFSSHYNLTFQAIYEHNKSRPEKTIQSRNRNEGRSVPEIKQTAEGQS